MELKEIIKIYILANIIFSIYCDLRGKFENQKIKISIPNAIMLPIFFMTAPIPLFLYGVILSIIKIIKKDNDPNNN